MTDMQTGSPVEDLTPTPPGAATPLARPTRGQKRKPNSHRLLSSVGIMIGVIGGLCWMAWATKNIVDSVEPKHQLVKLQLQGVMTEYLQAQARSGSDDQTAAAATTRFMAELDKAVAEVSKSGRVVLVNEAVIGGDIPDITQQVKQTVYSKVPMPKVAAATPVVQDMQAYLAANGAQNAPAGSPLDAMGAAGGNPQ